MLSRIIAVFMSIISVFTAMFSQVISGAEFKNEISKGKKVYGIICLNSPTQELIDKVHGDKRMKLFEYQISYTEL